MKTDELKIKISNTRERLNEFADIIGDVIGVNDFDFIEPEDREPQKKKRTLLEELWDI